MVMMAMVMSQRSHTGHDTRAVEIRLSIGFWESYTHGETATPPARDLRQILASQDPSLPEIIIEELRQDCEEN
jgi:hypothetical protein